ncbi:MAG: TetR/AcrR family transcriptional regulator [Eubacteriaceae bacterium]|nr:TetR/AcrR family transcriptional regulator [Eubacteriaceae bacterium]
MKNKNVSKKEEILNTSQHLFYENGFLRTSFEEIAEYCNITKPLITYHFGSKALLGGTIFGKYSKKMSDLFFEKAYENFSGKNNIDIVAAFTLMQLKYYQKDEKAFRFYYEFFSSSFADVTVGIEDFYKMSNRLTGNKYSMEELHMIYIGSNYAARGLIYHFITGNITCSEEQFELYYLESGFWKFGIDEIRLKEIHKNAKAILENISINFLPDFKWN